jgi:hypothetical protein
MLLGSNLRVSEEILQIFIGIGSHLGDRLLFMSAPSLAIPLVRCWQIFGDDVYPGVNPLLAVWIQGGVREHRISLSLAYQ